MGGRLLGWGAFSFQCRTPRPVILHVIERHILRCELGNVLVSPRHISVLCHLSYFSVCLSCECLQGARLLMAVAVCDIRAGRWLRDVLRSGGGQTGANHRRAHWSHTANSSDAQSLNFVQSAVGVGIRPQSGIIRYSLTSSNGMENTMSARWARVAMFILETLVGSFNCSLGNVERVP